jgi:RNA polymerase sigma-70 factor (ECF subfamily)
MTSEEETQRTERELVLDARTGDVTAFKSLYQQNRDRIYNLAFYMLGDALWAEDMVQTVFFKAHRGLQTFRLESAFVTWIYRIALNECQNQLRGRRAQFVPIESVFGRDEEFAAGLPPDLEHQERQRGDIVRRAVMDLTPKLRAVVVLKYFEGLSYDETAHLLDCSPGTVASRMNRALRKIEARLRPLKGMI